MSEVVDAAGEYEGGKQPEIDPGWFLLFQGNAETGQVFVEVLTKIEHWFLYEEVKGAKKPYVYPRQAAAVTTTFRPNGPSLPGDVTPATWHRTIGIKNRYIVDTPVDNGSDPGTGLAR